jgi:hypothetical protein
MLETLISMTITKINLEYMNKIILLLYTQLQFSKSIPSIDKMHNPVARALTSYLLIPTH